VTAVDPKKLKAALEAEGVELNHEVFDRVARKLANPDGCEWCGMHIKVCVMKSRKMFTACCGRLIGASAPTKEK
jgi:hypothetical protein